jgi:hypothetical protein
MVAEWGKGDGGETLRETALLYEFLGILLKNKKPSAHDDRIEKAIGLMETKYHEHLNIDDIAREIGLERSYFSVLFKEKTAVSPHKYFSISSIAAHSSAPSAITVTDSPVTKPKLIIPIILFAFTFLPSHSK